MGYDVSIMVEDKKYKVPTWVDEDLTNHPHIAMTDPKLTVGVEDFLIIPEVYSNIMEQTKNLPCTRIGLLQSIDYMLNALIPGVDWSTFGINTIITTSVNLKNIVNTYYGDGKYKILTYNIGIPDYFKKSTKPQKPIISIVGRNANEISKVVKLFFSKYPQYSWVTFDPMLTRSKPAKKLRRVDFAQRLGENIAAVWIDRISSFGTFPLECMKVGTIPIALKPDIIPEYLIERNEAGDAVKLVEGGGIWTDDIFDIPILIADVLIKYLDDSISDDLYTGMDNVVAKYTEENSKNELTALYLGLVENKIKLLESGIVLEAKVDEIKSEE